MRLLRAKLLTGRRVALGDRLPAAIADALREHGAELEPVPCEQLTAAEDQVGGWARAHAPLDALVWDGGAAFGDGGPDRLEATLAQAWATIRELATGALIPAPSPAKLLLIAPRPEAGALAGAARAGLENLVRTLSVEWARHGLTAVLITPGPSTTEEQLAQLACFVVSEAGGYLSGSRLELGAVSAEPGRSPVRGGSSP